MKPSLYNRPPNPGPESGCHKYHECTATIADVREWMHVRYLFFGGTYDGHSFELPEIESMLSSFDTSLIPDQAIQDEIDRGILSWWCQTSEKTGWLANLQNQGKSIAIRVLTNFFEGLPTVAALSNHGSFENISLHVRVIHISDKKSISND